MGFAFEFDRTANFPIVLGLSDGMKIPVDGSTADWPDEPRAALDRYFATAFTSDTKRFWHLWIEAAAFAVSDDFMKAAFREASKQAHERMREVLVAGGERGFRRLADPDGTALRLDAIYDGLAVMLLSPAQDMDAAQAEAHLRKAFELECQASFR
jgi:hypothetical protein